MNTVNIANIANHCCPVKYFVTIRKSFPKNRLAGISVGNDLNRKRENLPSTTGLRRRCTMEDAYRPLRVCGTDRASSAQGIPKVRNPL